MFSSVAGERGRKPVAIYGASKAGLTRYLEALDHKYRAEGLKTICVKPGFVRTGMTHGLKPPPFAGVGVGTQQFEGLGVVPQRDLRGPGQLNDLVVYDRQAFTEQLVVQRLGAEDLTTALVDESQRRFAAATGAGVLTTIGVACANSCASAGAYRIR